MKLLISLTLTWVFGFTLPLLAQDKLHGRVTDAETSRPLEAVMISVMRNGMTIDYTLTDANGRYSLPWHHTGSLQVSASLLGYKRMTYDVTNGRELNFVLSTESIVLKEVEIRPGRISSRRDTIRYNLADFATAKDTHIKDVLKRLPGIDVKENGTVTYKGKPIDHFLVEGMDVTGGRYNQVNNNLEAKAVKSAELMENYQSVRALSGKLDSEEVALNLKLDDQARDQWFPSLKAGGGVTEETDGTLSPLWEVSLNALQLGRGRQSIFSLKTNNTGYDLSNEQLQLATGHQTRIDLPDLLSQSSISTPLDTRRLLFNETYTANANRMYRRNDERTLRLQADYTRDHISQQRGNTQTFYQTNDTIQLEEAADYRLTTDALHADLTYEDNSTTHYLTNRLALEAERSQGQANELNQTIETTHLKAHNHLNYLKNHNENTWELTSDIQLASQPSTLRLPDEQNEYLQHSLYTSHAASLLHKHNDLTSSLKANVTAEWARYRMEHPNDVMSYNASQLTAQLSPRLQWERGPIFASMEVPVSWAHYFGAQQSYFLYSPSLYLRYRYDYHWKFSVYGSFRRSAGNALDLCPFLRRTDYRTLTTTNGLMPLSNTFTGQIYAEYKNTVLEFFATASLSYSHGQHSTLYEQYLSTDTLSTIRRDFKNSTDSWTLTSSLSKGIFDWHLKVSLDLQMTRYYGQQLTRTSVSNSATLQNFRYDYLQAEPKVVWSPVNWLEATYHATIDYSYTRIDNDTELTPLLNVVQRLRLNFSIGKIDLAVSGEHYKNDLSNGNRTNTLLADVSATWRNDRWRIEASLNNLFNKKTYAYTTYTATQSRTDWLRIRPREILATVSYSF